MQFSSTSFSGSELAGEVLVTIVMSGGTADRNVTIPISLNGGNATGQLQTINVR